MIGRRRGRDTRVGGTIKSPRDPKKDRLTDCGLTERTDTDVQKYKRECMRDRHACQERRQEGYYGELWDGLPLPCGQERTLGREYDKL